MLPAIENETGNAAGVGLQHGFANDGEGLLAHLVGRCEIVGAVVPDPAD